MKNRKQKTTRQNKLVLADVFFCESNDEEDTLTGFEIKFPASEPFILGRRYLILNALHQIDAEFVYEGTQGEGKHRKHIFRSSAGWVRSFTDQQLLCCNKKFPTNPQIILLEE